MVEDTLRRKDKPGEKSQRGPAATSGFAALGQGLAPLLIRCINRIKWWRSALTPLPAPAIAGSGRGDIRIKAIRFNDRCDDLAIPPARY